MTSQSYLQLLYPLCSTKGDSIPSPPWFDDMVLRGFLFHLQQPWKWGHKVKLTERLCPGQYPTGALPQPLWGCFASSISKSWLIPGQTCLQQEQRFHYNISWIRGTGCQFANLQLFLVAQIPVTALHYLKSQYWKTLCKMIYTYVLLCHTLTLSIMPIIMIMKKIMT